MVEDVARVVEAVASVVGAIADAGEEVVDADQISASSIVVAAKLLKPVVQMIWSTVNVSPSATATKSRMITI
jgi:hypothetical protein